MAATGIEIDINLPGPTKVDRGSLLGAARPIPEEAAGRWPLGVTWLPWGTGDISTDASDCVVIYDKDTRELPDVAVNPAFVLYDSLRCTTLSSSVDWLWDRVNSNLDVYASAAVAAELETATQSGSAISLTGTTGTVVEDAAVSPKRAVAALERHLGNVLHGGRGVIHLTPFVLSLAVSDSIVEYRDGQYRSPGGHVVVGDAGHTGTATPQGGTAVSTDESWAYATGDVFAQVGPRMLMDSSTDGHSQVLIRRNENQPLGERYGIVLFDPDTLGAAKVDETA